MAGPLIELLDGLRERRQRRRSGWGGGEAPGLRNLINPLDSQGMADRAQGVDVSEALPATRLEARPAPQAATAEMEPASASPFRTAAGSNAKPQPTATAQYPQYFEPQGQCVGGNCGGRVISERVTAINGVPVEQAGGATASSPTASTTTAGAVPYEGFAKKFAEMAANPQSASYAGMAVAAMEDAMTLNRMANSAGSIGEKHALRKQGFALGMQGIQLMALAQKQADERRREEYAKQQLQMSERALQSGTLKGRLAEANEVLRMQAGSPDDLAAAATQEARVLRKMAPLDAAQLQKDPEYRANRSAAHNYRIARHAATEFFSTGYAWGDEGSRRANANLPFAAAAQYYGTMPLAQAQQEIDRSFKFAYQESLTEQNSALPPEQRRSQQDINTEAAKAGEFLKTILYHQANPPRPEAQAAPAAQAKVPARPVQQPADHPWRRSPQPPMAAPVRPRQPGGPDPRQFSPQPEW